MDSQRPTPRRTPRSGPGGSGAKGAGQSSPTGPNVRGTRPRTPQSRTPPARPGDTRPGAARSGGAGLGGPGGSGPGAPGGSEPGPRFTGRAAVLVMVLAVLTVSYASSMRAYIQQRSHLGELNAQIAEREASINSLEREKRRWDDPAYVKAQARARLGYLMPGESGFKVIGPDGSQLEPQATLHDPSDVIKTVPTPWWTAAWDSMELAGNPPPPAQEPADLIDGTKQ